MTQTAPPPDIPRLRARRRNDHEVQLGMGERRGTILSGLSDEETRAITELGPLTAFQWSRATSTRPPSARWDHIVELLGRAAHEVTQHAGRTGTVIVAGSGPIPDALAGVLTSIAGRVITETHEIHQLEQGVAGPAHQPLDLVVLPCQEGLAPPMYAGWQRLRIPHLPVVVEATQVMIGPLVRPGTHGPCLRCLDRHRTARDPHWPDLVTQLDSAGPLPGEVTTAPDLVAMTAGLVGLTTRGLLAGRPLPAGTCLSVASPRPQVQYHVWTPHPECACMRADRSDTRGAVSRA
ncbi:TOMM precursor leader peptide-binding protein [Leekyejoonella antrihumi]|uniref:TOMM leader peptide-binding protein n=1 Tax=Leekyejoonella antrihumi TaxID=1660198 RepID=A0A563DZD0_9MICO|nr:TOMM precursor leader peptide-binding protein [Leekyejoonella antrihumi]TWP35313.1 TOMM precursor leader peptide-binding protein [Leekyejoonella antrihumi]